MEEPLAAALGAGVDITQPEGHMVVDIGGGTTDVAVTALGGVVASACLSTAGDQFDEALMQYIRQKHSLLIGARTAEEVKEAIGRVDGPGEETLAVKGRCLNTGLPREILLSGEETAEAFTPVAENIISAVQAVLERTPPELPPMWRSAASSSPGAAACFRAWTPCWPPGPGWRPTWPRTPSAPWPWGWSRPCRTWPNGRKGS